MSDPLATLDATAQADLVRRGEVKPLELVEAAIARIESLNPQLNAVIHPLYEKARAAAASPQLPEGPFRGVPFLLKDLNAQSAGDPYHVGMRLLRDRGWTAEEDAFLVTRLRGAGVVFVGRTNTPELGSQPTTEPEVYGPTRNPWDSSRSAGGSSGGSAAAVASGMVPAAHGNDGGGSIRIPASACGLVGLKPTRGRVSLGPQAGESWAGATVELALTRSVRDAAALLEVLAGPMPGDPYTAPPPARPFPEEVGADPGRLRVGLMAQAAAPGIDTHATCRAAAEDVGKLLESLGHHVEEAHPKALEDPGFGAAFTRMIACCTARELDVWSERTGRAIGPEDVEPMNWAVAELGRAVSAAEYIGAVEFLQAHTRRVAAWWEEGFDLLLTPTLAELPPPLGEFRSSREQPLRGWLRALPMVAFTSAWNATGQPAISLPLVWSPEGLPVGVQLVAAPAREDRLLRVASQLEQARPWADRRPPIHA